MQWKYLNKCSSKKDGWGVVDNALFSLLLTKVPVVKNPKSYELAFYCILPLTHQQAKTCNISETTQNGLNNISGGHQVVASYWSKV